jgi:hypothetical protein
MILAQAFPMRTKNLLRALSQGRFPPAYPAVFNDSSKWVGGVAFCPFHDGQKFNWAVTVTEGAPVHRKCGRRQTASSRFLYLKMEWIGPKTSWVTKLASSEGLSRSVTGKKRPSVLVGTTPRKRTFASLRLISSQTDCSRLYCN